MSPASMITRRRADNTSNEMKFLTRLLSRFRPRPVSAIVSDANDLVVELRRTASAQTKRADRLYRAADVASAEAVHAQRVAGKISELVS